MLHTPPKRHVVLKVFTENMLIFFSKRVLRAATARNKWLKEALICKEKAEMYIYCKMARAYP